MSDRRTRCPPLYYPSPGCENTFVVDHDPNGRYYLVGKGYATGIFNDPNRANEQTDGFSGFVKLKAKRWAGAGGARQLWDYICDEYHRDGCPPFTLPNGFTAPTPVNRDPPLTPIPAPAPAPPCAPATPAALNGFSSPRTPRAFNAQELPSSVSPSPLRAPPAATLAPSTPSGPPPPYCRLSPVVSSRGRPRVAPSTPVPASSFFTAASPRRREGTPLATPTSTPTSFRSRATPRTPVAASSVQASTTSGEDEGSVAEVVTISSDEEDSIFSSGEEFDYELPRVMWAVEGLAGEMFNTEDLAFASRLLSTLPNPRFMCSKNFRALDLFSRCLPDPDDDDFYA
ncbi:hypothetical protein C8R47DRAFT_1216607 [Mycena vitilis]|nr:hypothetical protein C8R47DRAFT_1230277 [Mycena vitilis]KAJ6453226.1 hypothetical protein C8R47DRAFT_1083525 [Mycena vitilis]KAJ6478862.1 hypothetical protein C8R47DRAFT_1219408 [Mycena vitilis]KAJ6486500.1 hypothetical protein C8R47DRAFT_1216607 [Mycena vitilis]